MKAAICVGALALAAFGASYVSAAVPGVPTAPTVGIPGIQRAEVSLDGRLLALSVANGDQRAVVIEQAADQKIVDVLRMGQTQVRNVEWVGSNHVLVTVSAGAQQELAGSALLGDGSDNGVVFDYDVAENRQTFLMRDVPHAVNESYGAPIPRVVDGKPYVFLIGQFFANTGGEGKIALFRADLDAHATTLAEMAPRHGGNWVVDAQGHPLAVATFDRASGVWTLSLRSGPDWRTVKTVTAPTGHPSINGLGRDGRSVLINDRVDNQRVVREIAPDGQDWSAPVVTAPLVLVHDPATYALTGYASLAGGQTSYTFFDPKDQAIWRGIQNAYPGQMVTLAGESADHRRLLVKVVSPKDPPGFALVDLDTKSADWIGDAARAQTP